MDKWKMPVNKILVLLFLALAVILTLRLAVTMPVITIPVQRTETYVDTELKQEPYTVTEKQEEKVRQITNMGTRRVTFGSGHKTKQILLGFWDFDSLHKYCNCSTSDSLVGILKESELFSCFADSTEIYVSWSVAESDRGSTNLPCSCPPHAGIGYYGGSFEYEGKRGWNGEEVISKEIVQRLPQYSNAAWLNILLFFFAIGYDCPCIGNMPPIDVSLSYFWYETKMADKQVTKYRDVSMQVEKQRMVTEYKKVSIWQWLTRSDL